MRELTVERYQSKRKQKGVTARYRAKRKRADDAWAKYIRVKCVLRDGYCKFSGFGDCSGPSQHAHLDRWKRARTRGQAPELRHTMEGSCMACEIHHGAEERGDLKLSMFADLGAQGPIVATYHGRRLEING